VKFKDLIYPLLKREGGYVSHPSDRGGSTNYGVTQAVYAKWLTKYGKPWADVRGLDEDTAVQIYHENYWKPAKCDLLPEAIREIHFDAAVNHGVTRAAKLLQEAAGVEQDGAIGEKTLHAIMEMDARLLKARYVNARFAFYGQIINRDRSQLVFIAGWMNRMAHFS